MANYTTLLKTWGDTGSEYPSGYSYLEGEQPVDAWDNFLIYNVVDDLDSLISLTNERIETDKGTSLPTSPEDSHIFSDEDDGSLHYYDLSTTSWHRLLAADGDTMAGVLDMGGYQIEDATGSLTLAGAVEAPNGSFTIGGNSALTTADEGAGNGIDADMVDGKHASELGLVVEEDGSVLVSPATAIDFTGHLNVTDDTDGTVTIDPSHSHAHSELSGVGSSDHHAKYTDAEARAAIEAGDVSKVEGDGGLTLVFDSNNNRFEFEDSANNRTEGLFSRVYLQDGAGWFEGQHSELAGIGASDHHSKTTSASELSDVSADSVADAHHTRLSPFTKLDEATAFNGGDGENVSTGDAIVRNGRLQLPSLVEVDDFEDGDVAEWTTNTWSSGGNFKAVSSPSLLGSWSGELSVNGNDGGSFAGIDLPGESGETHMRIRADDCTDDNLHAPGGSFTQDPNHSIGSYFPDMDSKIITYRTPSSGDLEIETGDGKTTVTGSLTHTWDVKIETDFNNYNVTVTVDGSVVCNNENMINQTGSGLEGVYYGLDSNNGNGTDGLGYIDFATNKNSASPLVYWGMPSDLYAWEEANFQVNPNGGSVSVDVEDGGGNTLISDISRQEDLSGISSGKEVRLRAHLSRSSKSENPTVDYLGRTFTR